MLQAGKTLKWICCHLQQTIFIITVHFSEAQEEIFTKETIFLTRSYLSYHLSAPDASAATAATVLKMKSSTPRLVLFHPWWWKVKLSFNSATSEISKHSHGVKLTNEIFCFCKWDQTTNKSVSWQSFDHINHSESYQNWNKSKQIWQLL